MGDENKRIARSIAIGVKSFRVENRPLKDRKLTKFHNFIQARPLEDEEVFMSHEIIPLNFTYAN